MRILSTAALTFGLVCTSFLAHAQGVVKPRAVQNAPVVVELYTSQGCSSCPPADELLTLLAQQDDVLALALHVDYWDYIGWKDEFASPAHTKRQKGYAHAGERRMIYTPQMVIMGYEDVVGANAPAVAEVIRKYRQTPQPVALRAEQVGAEVTLKALAQQNVSGSEPLLIHLARYEPMQTVSITRGELRGHTLNYANVVEELSVIGQWDGSGEFSVTIPVEGSEKTAFFVQQGAHGRIVGALRLD